jgi:hypothetical protein
MKGRALIQYLIDTSDVVRAKKQEATEYLAKLEEAAQHSVQSDSAPPYTEEELDIITNPRRNGALPDPLSR